MKKSDAPPHHLTAAQRAWWLRLRTEFQIDDAAGLAQLLAAAEARDRAEQARLILKREGITVRDRFGTSKPHPCVQIERDSRNSMLAALKALKLAPEEAS